jgi:hypothetical protein
VAEIVLSARSMMTARKDLLAVASLAALVVFAGCSTPTSTEDEEQPITAEEISAGEQWVAGDGSEHADDEAMVVADEEESSLPYLDEAPFMDADATDDDLEPLSIDDMNETASCRRATGYRRGKAFSICVTKVDGKLVEVNTARAYLRMKRAAKKRGITLWVNSGFRTMAQQRYFWNCYQTKKCNGGNLAAPPGYSNHQSGSALDLNTTARGVYWFLSKYGKSYGFRRTVPSERWHWER